MDLSLIISFQRMRDVLKVRWGQQQTRAAAATVPAMVFSANRQPSAGSIPVCQRQSSMPCQHVRAPKDCSTAAENADQVNGYLVVGTQLLCLQCEDNYLAAPRRPCVCMASVLLRAQLGSLFATSLSGLVRWPVALLEAWTLLLPWHMTHTVT